LTKTGRRRQILRGGLVVLLLALFWLTLIFSVRHLSQTFDEGFHLVAGYRYVQCGDFGINSEHPPLVKLVAGAALRWTGAPAPDATCGQEPTTKDHGYELGIHYFYRQGLQADMLLFRARLAVSIFGLALALSAFFFARRMFGYWAGIFALALVAFEPTVLAHSALITTDVAVSAFLLLTVYMLYRFFERRGAGNLLLVGLTLGLTLASKHSGVLALPIVMTLFLWDWLYAGAGQRSRNEWLRGLLRRMVLLAVIFGVALAVLWTAYGFRYWPRPHHAPMSMSLADFLVLVRLQGTHGLVVDHAIPFAAKWHLAPLAYLYGLTDVFNVSHPGQPPFLLGKLYPHGQWFYFPVRFFIKSTVGFLVLLLLAVVAGRWRKDGRLTELVFLTVPPAIYFAAAMTSGLDIGYRHVLPIVGFLCVLIAGAAASLIRRNRRWIPFLCLLLFAHVAFSLVSYPDFMAYSSAFPLGKMQTYRYLSDSNDDWGQGLIETREWLRAQGIHDCYIAYDGAADLDYYGIPCRRLSGNAGDAEAVPPAQASGNFLISALSYSGIEWEPGDLNPYAPFRNAKPEANIGGSMLVYRGTFDLRALEAATYTARANSHLAKEPQTALAEATAAVALMPRSVRAHLAMAEALAATGNTAQARLEFERALKQAAETGSAWYPNQIAEAERGLSALTSK
jgi:hypothetical protein